MVRLNFSPRLSTFYEAANAAASRRAFPKAPRGLPRPLLIVPVTAGVVMRTLRITGRLPPCEPADGTGRGLAFAFATGRAGLISPTSSASLLASILGFFWT